MEHDIDKLPDYASVQRLAELVCRQLRDLSQEDFDRLIVASAFLPSLADQAAGARNGIDWASLLSPLHSNQSDSIH